MPKYGVWFSGRRTPVVKTAPTRSKAISAARRSGAAGSKGKVKSARQLTGASLRTANRGGWVRERASGKQVSGRAPERGSPRYRPGLGKK